MYKVELESKAPSATTPNYPGSGIPFGSCAGVIYSTTTQKTSYSRYEMYNGVYTRSNAVRITERTTTANLGLWPGHPYDISYCCLDNYHLKGVQCQAQVQEQIQWKVVNHAVTPDGYVNCNGSCTNKLEREIVGASCGGGVQGLGQAPSKSMTESWVNDLASLLGITITGDIWQLSGQIDNNQIHGWLSSNTSLYGTADFREENTSDLIGISGNVSIRDVASNDITIRVKETYVSPYKCDGSWGEGDAPSPP